MDIEVYAMIVKHIGIAHVKATRLLEPDHATITTRGVAGDRDFLLLDEKGEPVGPGRHRHFLPLRFEYDVLRYRLLMTYPDGRIVEGECTTASASESVNYLGMRNIQVASVEGPWSQLISDFSGLPVRLVKVVNTGDGVDVLPITVLTTGSLHDLARRLGPVDHRRFRANLIVECDEPYAEDGWNGQSMQVGSAVLKIRSSVPRCVVTQLDPENGQNNARTVAALLEFRDNVHLPDGLMPDYANPGFASYAEVVLPGEVRIGDAVFLRQP